MIKQIHSIREKISSKKLYKRASSNAQNKSVVNFYDAQHFGIAFNATQIENFNSTKHFVKKLENDYQKIVNVIGFFDSKEEIDPTTIRKGFEYFKKKDLNWIFYPSKNEDVQKFIDTPFDIVINLSVEDIIPINYCIANSKAKLKVSRFFEQSTYADILIDIPDSDVEIKNILDNTATKQTIVFDQQTKTYAHALKEKQLYFLINQSVHYLQVVRSK